MTKPAQATPPLSNIPRRSKAAMIVQMLLADGQRIGLSKLPETAQLDLSRELSRLRLIDKTTLNLVALEFAALLDTVALVPSGGVEGTLAALSDQISPATAARLREETAHTRGADPWAQVLALAPADLVPLMTTESIEVCAIALSKLPVAKAAELLSLLPGDRARRITYAISQTSGVAPDAVARIGAALATEYGTPRATAFAQAPFQRVGAILNSSPAATRDDVLAGLGDTDPAFADKVRKSIFTFLDIPARLAAGDVPKVVRAVEGAVLVTALAAAKGDGGATAEVADFILSNMSKRMAEQLTEEIGEKGRVRKSEGETAQTALISAIREQAETGEITLRTPDEPED